MSHKSILLLIDATSLLNSAFGSDKPIKMKDLPPAVQKAAHEQTKGAELKGLSKEVENGKTFYEVETVVNDHGRDLLLDKTGTLVEVEEEVALDSIPAPVKSAIAKKAAGGKITKVEMITKGPSVSYEAAITKTGKKLEVAVNQMDLRRSDERVEFSRSEHELVLVIKDLRPPKSPAARSAHGLHFAAGKDLP